MCSFNLKPVAFYSFSLSLSLVETKQNYVAANILDMDRLSINQNDKQLINDLEFLKFFVFLTTITPPTYQYRT